MRTPIKMTNDCTIIGRNLDPEIVEMVHAARDTAPDFVDSTMWITAGTNGSSHMPTSLHYHGEAWDIRVHNVSGFNPGVGGQQACPVVSAWLERIKASLNKDAHLYDCIYETKQQHIHLEYQPKIAVG